MLTINLKENIFLFKIKPVDEVTRIFNGNPWAIIGNHLVLKRWFADAFVQDIHFSKSYFLVWCFGVLLDMKSSANLQKLGEVGCTGGD